MKAWILASRPKTLPAAAIPVGVGSALAYAEDLFSWVPALICLGFALLVQIGTNFVNDYLDFQKGSDREDRIGPARAVASGWVSAIAMKRASIIVLAAAFCLGLGLIPYGGWWLLAVGVISILCAYLYTGGPYPLAYHGLGDLFVVVFFGWVAVGCSYYVQTGHISREALALGLGVGLLVNNILVINNYRDADQDRVSGKKTLAVRFGRGVALLQYQISVVLASLVPLYLFLSGYSEWVLLGCITYPLGRFLTFRISQMKIDRSFNRALGWTSGLLVLYGLLVGVGLVVGG